MIVVGFLAMEGWIFVVSVDFGTNSAFVPFLACRTVAFGVITREFRHVLPSDVAQDVG